MDIFYIAILTLVTSIIGTITGFGTSTLMIPVLVIFLPLLETIFLVSIIHWFGNVWKIILFREGFNLRLVALFGLSGLFASYLGAYLSFLIDDQFLLQLLGYFIVVYSVLLLLQPNFKIPPRNMIIISGGALSGFFAGMFGIGGSIRSMFLSAFNLPKVVYLATVGVIGIMVDSTRIATYFFSGATFPDRLWYGLLLFIPISFLGAGIAKGVVAKIPQDRFRDIVAVSLFIVGLKLVLF